MIIIYKKSAPELVVMSVDSAGNPQLTTNESLAMTFTTAVNAEIFIKTLNPSSNDFWGTRPSRPK